MIHFKELDEYEKEIEEMTFEPMKVTFHMGSSVVTSDYIFLDGLISSAVFKDKVLEYWNVPENRDELIYIPLPLKRYGTNESFYAASIGFAPEMIEGVERWRKRTEIESKKKIQVGSGQYKIYDMPMPTQYAESWVFYANGNIEEVQRLLTTHICSIGKKCSQGFGEVKAIEISASDHDWSIVKGGVPMRPIPASEAGEFDLDCDVKMFFAFRPPYWHKLNMTECFMPLCRV
jgi:hypothetical protein